MRRIVFTIFAALAVVFSLHAQEGTEALVEKSDSMSTEEIVFSPASASIYIDRLLNTELLWKPGSDSLKIPLSRLNDQYKVQYDSIETRLSEVHFAPVSFRKVDTFNIDTLPLRWLNDSTFFIDTIPLNREPLFTQKTVVKRIVDSLVFVDDSAGTEGNARESFVRIKDTTITEKYDRIIDTALLRSFHIQLFQLKNRQVVPKLFSVRSNQTYHFLADGSKLTILTPVQLLVADKNSPFNIVPNEKISDSLNIAVQTLLSYTNKRDSIPIFLTNMEGYKTPFWLTVGDDELQRYWVKNRKNDSVSIWMGNPDKRNISFMLEEDIHVERIEKETVDDVPFTMAMPTLSLIEMEPFKEIPVYWDYNFSSSFSLSQNYLSNWAKGGESSLSNLLDIKGQAKYTNKAAKTEWTGNGRLKYGSVFTEEYEGLRTSTDLLEFDSKYNKGIRKKTDLSALFHMKSQVAKGYSYPNDSVAISKFLNPLTFTIGVGVEYKPFKKSTVNFSILSYKNTFVLDTTNFDQTIHGIDADKRANQEMGGQVLIKNELTLFDDLKINNSMRLFSNYLDKPGNVDVEWEIDLEKQLSLYFTVLLNMHLIYDDDIRFPKTEGSEQKIPKLQFKEFLGLTFLVKF